MTNPEPRQDAIHSPLAKSPVLGRLAYRRPELQIYGDLLGLTLGGSPGAGDSGMSSGTKNVKTFLLGFEELP